MRVYFLANGSRNSELLIDIERNPDEFAELYKPVKIGVTGNVEERIKALQTGNPKELMLMGYIESDSKEKAHEIERLLHQEWRGRRARKNGEWFKLRAVEVLDTIRRFGRQGFLAVSKDSLKVLGFDSDGVLEIGGVWDWGYLHWEDCCPFCGCLCGLIYEEEVMLHECLNCGYQNLEDVFSPDEIEDFTD